MATEPISPDFDITSFVGEPNLVIGSSILESADEPF